jgi:hypothetical protein
MSKLRIKQGVRIRDVAAAAGVSRTTVSLIVNGRADQVGISLATRQRVSALVSQMGYVPSSAAREMATGHVVVAAEAATVTVSQPLATSLPPPNQAASPPPEVIAEPPPVAPLPVVEAPVVAEPLPLEAVVEPEVTAAQEGTTEEAGTVPV